MQTYAGIPVEALERIPTADECPLCGKRLRETQFEDGEGRKTQRGWVCCDRSHWPKVWVDFR